MFSEEWTIRNHITEAVSKADLDWVITISFVQTDPLGKHFCLTKRDIPDAYRMVRTYVKAATEKMRGRSNKLGRSPEMWLPMILLPEYRTKTGDPTFLHYHGFTHPIEGREAELASFTEEFWRKMGERNFQSPIKATVEPATTVRGSAYYATKWLEDQFTLENSVVVIPVQ